MFKRGKENLGDKHVLERGRRAEHECMIEQRREIKAGNRDIDSKELRKVKRK